MWISVALLPRKSESYGETSGVCVVEIYYYVPVFFQRRLSKAVKVPVKRVVKGDQPVITRSFNSLYSGTLHNHIYQ